jgi:broad specificity phosphatase PhoE
MKIVLMRHGEPKIDLSDILKKRCSANELKTIFDDYIDSGLNTQKTPPLEALRVAKNCNAVVCSDLLRSIESATALGVLNIDFVDSIFREPDVPITNWRYPKLTVFTWGNFFRALWYLGYSKRAEPITSVKQRAETAAIKLQQMANEHGSVVLIGHVIINRFVAKKLRYNGWSGPKNPGYGYNYLEYGVYEHITI